MTTVVVEHTDGRELARISDVAHVPREGELIEVPGALLTVRTVLWSLTDGPLMEVRLIVESDET